MAGLECIAMAVAHLESMSDEAPTESEAKKQKIGEEHPMTIHPSASTLSPQASPQGPDKPPPRSISSDSSSNLSLPESSPLASYVITPTASSSTSSMGSFAEVPTLDFAMPSSPLPEAPTESITDINENDVLCGRGGETNHFPGNVRYRSLVKCYQPLYIASKRRDKPRIARKIVMTIRLRGGRFLKKDGSNPVTWKDVGNTKAREKTSQALREGAPELRHASSPKVQASPEALALLPLAVLISKQPKVKRAKTSKQAVPHKISITSPATITTGGSSDHSTSPCSSNLSTDEDEQLLAKLSSPHLPRDVGSRPPLKKLLLMKRRLSSDDHHEAL